MNNIEIASCMEIKEKKLEIVRSNIKWPLDDKKLEAAIINAPGLPDIRAVPIYFAWCQKCSHIAGLVIVHPNSLSVIAAGKLLQQWLEQGRSIYEWPYQHLPVVQECCCVALSDVERGDV